VTAIGADLVVVGTHGSSGLKKLVTGSKASRS
jgi:nucleotide-binding universal stress UspA family protein